MKCEICGKEIEQSDYSNAIVCSKECYMANFWLNKYHEYLMRPNTVIVYKGVCYTLGDSTDAVKGFNGKSFKVSPKHKEPTYVTDNLWSNGPIPMAFRRLMYDNVLKLEVLK